jgi:hypothetical protein
MKKLVMPQELEVWYLLPAIRKELAREMVRQGLSQKQAAGKLGITEAAVSQYLKGKRGSDVEIGGAIRKDIKKSVKRILDGGCLMGEIQCICNECRKKMVLCRIHRKHGHVSSSCRICLDQ